MSKRILVVEDQADNRQIIRNMLAPTDYEISEGKNRQRGRRDAMTMCRSLAVSAPTGENSTVHAPLGLDRLLNRLCRLKTGTSF
jgi:CheY-like chemotaxis protein